MLAPDAAVSEPAPRFATSALGVDALPPLQLRELGPPLGGRLDGIVVLEDGTLLVASPGGAVWRREQDSASWEQPANRGLVDFTIQHLALDLLDRSVVYAVGRNGLFRTVNRGEDWDTLIGGALGAPLPDTGGAVVDPAPFAQLQLSATERVLFWSSPCRGISWSRDGIRWRRQRIVEAFDSPDNCIGNIAADPETGYVFVSTLHKVALRRGIPAADALRAHVFRSRAPWTADTRTASFDHVARYLPYDCYVASLAAASLPDSGRSRVVALIHDDNGLRTFVGQHLDADEADPRGFRWSEAPVLPPGNNQESPRPLLYAGDGQEMFHGNVDAFQLLDLGAGWCDILTGSSASGCLEGTPSFTPHIDVRGLFLQRQPGSLWAVTDGTGNGGSVLGPWANVMVWPWTPGSPIDPSEAEHVDHSGLAVWQAYYAALVPFAGAGRRVFVGSQDNFALCFNRAEAPLSYTHHGAPTGIGGDYYALALAPSDFNRAYAVANSGLLARSFNAATSSPNGCGAVEWDIQGDEEGEQGLPCIHDVWHRNVLAVSPHDADRVFMACTGGQLGVAVSQNAGSSWEVRPVLPAGTGRQRGPVTAIHVDEYGVLYAGLRQRPTEPGGVYASLDDGEHWSPIGLQAEHPEAILAIAGRLTGTLWAATSQGLYRRGREHPGGPLLWQLVLGGQEMIVTDVEVDPSCTNGLRAYVGWGFWDRRQQHGGGVWMTTDGGDDWTPLTTGSDLDRAPVTDVDVDPIDPSLVAVATFGRGVWTLRWPLGAPQCE